MAKTEEAIGWAVRVAGPLPYLSYYGFGYYRQWAQRECTETYHRPMRAVLLPLREYRRLKRLAGEGKARKGR
jgi:hypothetical protein